MTSFSLPELHDLLHVEPERGLIRLDNYRMVMMSACALGALRKELVETLGWDQARGLMKRFGHAAGLADGLALSEMFPGRSKDQHMAFGPALHALEGIATVERIDESTEVDLGRGTYHVEGYWHHSFEAEQHLETFGRSDEPVCWTLSGYATGHASAAAGMQTVTVETECVAMGHARCRFVSTLAQHLPDAARQEQADYEARHLPDVLKELLDTIQRQKRNLRTQTQTIHQLQSRLTRLQHAPELIGTSGALRKAKELAEVVAPVPTTVLILGESGTGKELFARAIHEGSGRAGQNFVAINCGAIPENLQEAEFFGYAKGAFTGAAAATQGLFEAAHKGTLLLDEIGDLSLTAQTKILRALQEGEIKRLGETRTRKVDVRVLAATHQDLRQMIADKTFREDLYYRLSVVTLELPPLRERDNDILLLAKHFLERFNTTFGKQLMGFSRDAQCALLAYPWPGNVRELENAVQRAVILARGDDVALEDLPESVSDPKGQFAGGAVHIGDVGRVRRPATDPRRGELMSIVDEGQRISKALEMTVGNKRAAAELLGMSRTTLWRKLK